MALPGLPRFIKATLASFHLGNIKQLVNNRDHTIHHIVQLTIVMQGSRCICRYIKG